MLPSYCIKPRSLATADTTAVPSLAQSAPCRLRGGMLCWVWIIEPCGRGLESGALCYLLEPPPFRLDWASRGICFAGTSPPRNEIGRRSEQPIIRWLALVAGFRGFM